MVERTLIFFKPDAIERGIVNEIIEKYIIKNSFKIISVKPVVVCERQIFAHYNKNLRDKKEEIYKRVSEFYTDKMILLILLEKDNAILEMRRIIGMSDPVFSPSGTIRGDYGDDSYEQAEIEERSCRNILHASDSHDEFIREYDIWFNNIF